MAAGLGSHLIRLLVVLAALTPEGVSVPRGGAIRAPARRLLHVGGPLVRDTASEKVHGDLAEALLDGTADDEKNVRLFNSLFRVDDGNLGMSVAAHKESDEVGPGRGGAGTATSRREQLHHTLQAATINPHATRAPTVAPATLPELPELSAVERSSNGPREILNKCSNKTNSPCNVCDKCCHPYVPDGPLCDECFDQQCPARPTPSPTMRPLTPEEKAAREANERHLKALARGPGLKPLASGQKGWTATYVDPQDGYASVEKPELPVRIKNGALSVTDSSSAGPVWYWKSPKMDAHGYPMTGNMDSLYDGLLSFQLQQSSLGKNEVIPSNPSEGSHRVAERYQSYGDVVLRGGHQNSKRTLIFFFDRYTPTSRQPQSKTPTYYDIRLAPVDGDPAQGQPWVERTDVFDKDATEDDIKDVLSNLDFILIRGRYQTGTQTSMISNIEVKGCPLKCSNGGKLIRDRCVCHCRKGYVGDKCNQRVQFDMESLTDQGRGTRKCLTICRPKLSVTDSGQETKLSCKQEHNTVYYSSAVPIVMFTQCQGHSNQLFFTGQGNAINGSWYESVALRGYCLGVGNEGAMRSLDAIDWTPNGYIPLTVTMCSKYNSYNKWRTEHVRDKSQATTRLVLGPRNTMNSTGMCIEPHHSWNGECRDTNCGLLGSSLGVERQAVVRECSNHVNSNQLLVRQSQYLLDMVSDMPLGKSVDNLDPREQSLVDEVSSQMPNKPKKDHTVITIMNDLDNKTTTSRPSRQHVYMREKGAKRTFGQAKDEISKFSLESPSYSESLEMKYLE